MTDLIIGMAAGYSDDVLYPFTNSLARSGFDGDFVLIRDYPVRWHPAVDRFDYIPCRIEASNYRYVIACDTADIVFQSNPMEWLEKNLGEHDLVVVSEEKTFSQCAVNGKVLMDAFPESYELMKDAEIVNGGVIAGKGHSVAKICREIYMLCKTDQRLLSGLPKWEDHLPDQVALNRLLPSDTLIARGRDAFAFQYNHKHSFRDGEMFNENGVRYAILHQYLYQWNDEVKRKYA